MTIKRRDFLLGGAAITGLLSISNKSAGHTNRRFQNRIQPGMDKNGEYEECRLLCIGIGVAGIEALDFMMKTGINAMNYAAVDTDTEILEKSSAPSRLQLGWRVARGQSTYGSSNIAREAALDETMLLKELLPHQYRTV